MRIVHYNDIGTAFDVEVRDQDGAEIPELENATVLKFIFERPSGNAFERDAMFVAPTTLRYVTEDGDLNEVGKWTAQGYVEFEDSKGHSSSFQFEVKRILTP